MYRVIKKDSDFRKDFFKLETAKRWIEKQDNPELYEAGYIRAAQRENFVPTKVEIPVFKTNKWSPR